MGALAGPLRRSAQTAAALAALALIVLSLAPATARAQESLETQVKATFLFRFGDFVTWPDWVFPPFGGPLNLCIVGEDPFGEVLDEMVAGQQAAGRPVIVYRLGVITAESGCHIVYVAGSPQQSTAEALEALRGAPVLTVTDEARGPVRGAVHFEVADDRVRFHIDERAAADNGVVISSRLLDIALTVRRRDE